MNSANEESVTISIHVKIEISNLKELQNHLYLNQIDLLHEGDFYFPSFFTMDNVLTIISEQIYHPFEIQDISYEPKFSAIADLDGVLTISLKLQLKPQYLPVHITFDYDQNYPPREIYDIIYFSNSWSRAQKREAIIDSLMENTQDLGMFPNSCELSPDEPNHYICICDDTFDSPKGSQKQSNQDEYCLTKDGAYLTNKYLPKNKIKLKSIPNTVFYNAHTNQLKEVKKVFEARNKTISTDFLKQSVYASSYKQIAEMFKSKEKMNAHQAHMINSYDLAIQILDDNSKLASAVFSKITLIINMLERPKNDPYDNTNDILEILRSMYHSEEMRAASNDEFIQKVSSDIQTKWKQFEEKQQIIRTYLRSTDRSERQNSYDYTIKEINNLFAMFNQFDKGNVNKIYENNKLLLELSPETSANSFVSFAMAISNARKIISNQK